MLNYINGDLIGRTNLTNFRASERNQVYLNCRVQQKISKQIFAVEKSQSKFSRRRKY